MQQMLPSRDTIDTSSAHPSAFQSVSPLIKSPKKQETCARNRDSGYSSDFSPAGVKTPSRRFTFDFEDVDSDLCNNLDENDISADEDVFVDQFEPLIHVIKETDESDDADKEVAALLRSEANTYNTVAVQRCRPSAPLTVNTNDTPNGARSVDTSRDLCLIASPFYHTRWNTRDRYRPMTICRNAFRPIVSRSVGTQTPNPHCQLVLDAMLSNKLTLSRGRLRVQSENEENFCVLPDVVPISRDRSSSLPEVPSFHRHAHEQHVGRELRRISDDFHSTYLRRHGRRQRTRSEDPSMSSRFNVDLPGYWNSLRRFVSSSPIFHAWSSDHN